MADKTKLDVLIKKRGFVRQKITKLCNKVERELADMSTEFRALNLDKSNLMQIEIIGLDKEIFDLCMELGYSDEDLGEFSSDDETYTDKLLLTITRIKTINASMVSNPSVIGNSNHAGSSQGLSTNVMSNKLKLPQVPLPEFRNGKGENLKTFIRSFESIIDKHNLTSYEKYVYLRKQLSNAPLVLVDSLDVDERSYERAVELLQQAFDNTEQSKYEVINKLSRLKLNTNEDPYQFIGDMRAVIAAVKSLKINLDDVIGYFVWTGLNSNFQLQLTHITNKSKPSLEEINQHIFDATDRYTKQLNDCKQSQPRHVKNEVQSMAVNIKRDSPKGFCVLCSADRKNNEHWMKDCPAYPTARNKFDKLRSIKACTRCSFSNHETGVCQFKFKTNCHHCDREHMSYLSLKNKETTNVESNAITYDVITVVSILHLQ